MNEHPYHGQGRHDVRQHALGRAQMTLRAATIMGRVTSGAFAIAVALGLLSGITVLFQQQGTPLTHVTAAERGCVAYTYVSERDSCVRERLAAHTPT
jgi:hypothetical protein